MHRSDRVVRAFSLDDGNRRAISAIVSGVQRGGFASGSIDLFVEQGDESYEVRAPWITSIEESFFVWEE